MTQRPFALVPVRTDIGTMKAAGGANEPGFKIGEANVIRPLIAADRDVM
jgi:hypothetical protein